METIVAQASDNATRRVKAAVKADISAAEERAIEVSTKRAVEEAIAAVVPLERQIAKAHAWRAACLAGIAGLGLGIIIMWATGSTQNRLAAEAVGYGTVIGKAEKDQDTLTHSDDRGIANRGHEPASAPRTP